VRGRKRTSKLASERKIYSVLGPAILCQTLVMGGVSSVAHGEEISRHRERTIETSTFYRSGMNLFPGLEIFELRDTVPVHNSIR
jgi:hypothetical protein